MPRPKRSALLLAALAVVAACVAGYLVVSGGDESTTPTSSGGPESSTPGTGDGGTSVGPTVEPSVPPTVTPTLPAVTIVSDVDGYTWRPVRIGGGGNISGIGAADDGTLVARSDVYGAYIRRADAGSWEQLLTTASLPDAWHVPKMGKGVQEVALAPSDSTRIYVMWAGHLFSSADGGVSFVETSFAATPWNANGPFGRGFGDKMAVDPIAPDHVVAAGPDTPLRRSTDGGESWAETTVPAGLAEQRTSEDSGGEINSVGITGIAFDPGSPGADGRTSVIYAASWGNAVYRSTDGGESWDSIGGPTAVEHAGIDAGGAYYAVDGDRDGPFSVQRFDGDGWTEITPGDWNPNQIADVENPFLAASPTTEGTVVIGFAGQMFVTRDRGDDWDSLSWSDGEGDISWMPEHEDDYYLVASDLLFDPANPSRLYLSTGEGVQYADLPADGDQLTWIEQTRGMETMVATGIASTVDGPPVFSVFDFGQFSGSAELDDFELIKGPVDEFAGTTSISASPFAPGVAVSATTSYVGDDPVLAAAATADGGQSWEVFESMPDDAGSAEEFGYGTLAVSEPGNIVWAPGRYFPTAADSFQPYFTTDGGKNWAPVELPGVTSYPEDSIGGFMFGNNLQTIAADQVTPGTFYLYMLGQGVFRSTDGGANWTLVHDGDFTTGDPAFNAQLRAMPGAAGNLFYTDGPAGGHDYTGPQLHGGAPFLRSRDGGATWEQINGVDRVLTFGFGAPAPGAAVAAIYLAGDVNGEYGIWQSTDDAASWNRIGDYPYTVDWVSAISGDINTFGTVYIGFGGSSFVYGVPS